MGCDNQARHMHCSKPLLKGSNSNDNRGNPSCFQQTCDMSHGHVANWSNRYKDNGIKRLRPEQFNPSGTDALK